jgi:hypothetical protein
VIDGAGSDHEAWVDGAPDNAAQRVPGPVVEPVVEGVESLLCQVLGRPIVEIGIELVNHRLEPGKRKSKRHFSIITQKHSSEIMSTVTMYQYSTVILLVILPLKMLHQALFKNCEN